MYRKYVAPLSKKTIRKLMNFYTKNNFQLTGFNDFEFCLGQLYKQGIVEIKKQLENGNFILFISLTETGKELLKKPEHSIQPALSEKSF